MPINLFNDPLASLKLGADNIIKGYVGNASVFPNSLTLTIVFVDNTSANVNLDNASTVSFTGSPGANWSSFDRTLTRVNGTVRITGATGSENGDTQNILSIVESGSGSVARSLTFSGTLPTVTQTITVTVTDTVVNLLARSLSVGPGGSSTFSNISMGVISWTGDGIATLNCSTNYGAGRMERAGAIVAQAPFSINPGYGINATFVNGGSYANDVNQSGGTYPKTNVYTLSLPETLTYQSQSVSASYSKIV